ncbi:hypothetical protein AJ80_00769 [Polytolypa hystricis UAMH7299]|uniref:Major facilitator superfamily (MFS) profile domain-containing protein n=1 Tax=Polytolypa hystricis (strain UAMH7299) TaxID=1447883 RepID=A0A2B7Z326_POLH7|nr:hypothetical protein AJ80_00769 [Polytolypa hystricis UAMH7299]
MSELTKENGSFGPADDMIEDATSKGQYDSKGDDNNEIRGFSADSLPPGYYRSRFFLGSVLAIGLGLWSGTAAFGYAAPILGVINADIGPDPNYVWVSLVYNTVLAVCVCLVGRLSDIFGRRYFFIGGGALSLIGCIVCATAKTIPVLIGGNVLLGAATATQLSFHFVMGELVPVRHRYVANAVVYLFTIPGSGLGPLIAQAFVSHHPNVSWRGTYYLLIATNTASLAAWVAFYFPPTFKQKHENDTISRWLKSFDYVGMFLFSSGFVVFLLGLSWGGSVYAWDSAHVISTIVVGFVVLVAFVLWECFMDLPEPFVPMRLFLNVEWVVSTVILGLGAGVYYAFSIIWPQQVANLYGNGDPIYAGGISVIVGLCIVAGQISAGFLTNYIGHNKYQILFSLVTGGGLLGAVAVGTPDNGNTVIALIVVGCFFIGWVESLAITNVTITVRDQQEIGVAGGIAGSVRSVICTILTAVYTTILSNRLGQTVPDQVPPALIDAGLPESSVASFLSALPLGPAALENVQGINEKVLAAGMRAYKVACSDAYRTVYLSTLAFTGLAIILSFIGPDIEKYLDGGVAAVLNGAETETEPFRDEKSVDEEKGT